jgi:hypothetical protein
MATGQLIRASEYNAIRVKVEQILNTGGTVGETRGYGQPMLSSPVEAVNDVISREDWEALRRDIINIKIHQENPRNNLNQPVVPDVIQIPVGEPIRFGSSNPNTNFNTLIDQLIPTRLQIAQGRAQISEVPDTPVERTDPWSTQVSCNIEVTFPGYTRPDGYVVSPSNHARFFFNSGGRIRLYSRREAGAPKLQNNSWTTLLVQAGIREIAALQPSNLHFYNLTDVYQTLYEIAGSGPYAANVYRIEAKCNVPSNSQGTATKIFLRVFWIDDYNDPFPTEEPPDEVDGLLRLFVEEFKATGPIFNSISGQTPTGNFEIPSPVYSISPIFNS